LVFSAGIEKSCLFSYILYMIKKYFAVILFVFIACFAFSQEEEQLFPPQALLLASYRGNVDLIKEILAADCCDKDARDGSGATALHVAIFQSNLEVIRLLLDYGFDPNAMATGNGNTPLHNAVSTNNVGAARLLLQQGADKHQKNLDGLSPYAKAVREERRDLLLLFARF
jgi:ankyrin repeat protein